MTVFCPECFETVEADAARCPSCGASLHHSTRTYEDKLILALGHRLPDRRILAARILGQVRSRRAVPDLVSAALDGRDPYLAAEAVRALGRIGTDEALRAVEELAASPSVLVRDAARRALDPRRR